MATDAGVAAEMDDHIIGSPTDFAALDMDDDDDEDEDEEEEEQKQHPTVS
jgi:hypothetical protein